MLRLTTTWVALGLLIAAFIPSCHTLPSPPSPETLKLRSVKTKNVATSLVTDGALRYVQNSGICETTDGVNQYSGYVDLASNQHMWFWFFEARNNPTTAPFALWLNGGPGCSSMIGLFQENGPCQVSSDGSSTTLNPYSWNNNVNMIYVDQPIGVGFSYGTTNVGTSPQAAAAVWKFFQLLFTTSEFNQYQSREFGLWTESYGGHYGPEFAYYFETQNAAIASGSLSGVTVNLMALGINNGLYDPLTQYDAYYNFSLKSYNGYKDLASSSTRATVSSRLYSSNGCLAREQQCYSSGSSSTCESAENYCDQYVMEPLIGNLNVYDITDTSGGSFPSEAYTTYLSNSDVIDAIGAESSFTECSDPVGYNFAATGDGAKSFISQLASVLNSGLRTVIWAGDADWICNWLGGYRAMLKMSWSGSSQFNSASFNTLTYQGQAAGSYINAGVLSFAKITGAGHEVPAYKPEIALQVFEQTMNLQPVSST